MDSDENKNNTGEVARSLGTCGERGGLATTQEPSDQERYRLFFEQAVDGFYETNRAGDFVFFNEAFCSIFGRDREYMFQRNYRDFMENGNSELVNSRLQRIKAPDKVVQMKWKIIHREGRTRTLDVTVRAVFDQEGHHSGYRGMVRDVSHELQIQKAIRKSRKKINELLKVSQDLEKRYLAFLRFLPLPLVVQNSDLSVAYTNPAFEQTFGWTRKDLEQNPFAHIPTDQLMKSKTGKLKLFEHSELNGVETKCVTKDGRVLDVKSYGSVFYDQDSLPAGIVVALRNITKSKKNAETSNALFRIAKALHHYGDLDSRLAFISNQVQSLLQTENAHIILVDKEHKEFYFRSGAMHDLKSYQALLQVRVPLDDTYFAGKVILSGEPKIINDVESSKIELIVVNRKVKNLIGVPMELGSRVIGAMVASNKKEGIFGPDDVVLLSSIARMVALPIENARINDELRSSYQEIKVLNRAKDRIIDHLSHELRTPLSVLSASLGMLKDNSYADPAAAARILARCQRNIQRISAMESKLVDIIHDPDQEMQRTLNALLDLCADELESLADMEVGLSAGKRIREHIDELFRPRNASPEEIDLGTFVIKKVTELQKEFAHRKLEVVVDIQDENQCVFIPAKVLSKIISGLLRNSVEFTPDGGQITLAVADGASGPMLTVTDTGVGITMENQHLIFDNYFTTADVSRYVTGKPYDFNAGGSGFDLLRMRVFSERYNFTIILRSNRCKHIPTNTDICPGSIKICPHCSVEQHCYDSGGTCFTLQFQRLAEHHGFD